MRRLVSSSAGVVQEQKHCVVPAALVSAKVGPAQQRIQFVCLQVAHKWMRPFLRCDALNLTAPFQVFWAMRADESYQRMDRRKTLISRGDPTAATFFQILKESSGACWRDVFHVELVDPSVSDASNKRQELLQRIPIALLRIAGEIPLANEILQQKPADPGAQQIGVNHGIAPSRHSARNAGWLRAEGQASCSGTPAYAADG